MGSNMKTTIDIADALLDEARARARAEGTTVRALVEHGLRTVLGDPPGDRPYRYEPVTFELTPHGRDVDWAAEVRRLREEDAGRLDSRP